MFKSEVELVNALPVDDGLEGAAKVNGDLMTRLAVSLGSLILKRLPEGPNKELAKQRLIECIFYCKQSLKLKK